MAIDYARLFDRIKIYSGPSGFGDNFKETIDNQTLHGNSVLSGEIEDSDNQARLEDTGATFKSTIDSSLDTYLAELDTYLTSEGRDEAQSSGQTAQAVAEEIVTFMTRDSETVLENVIGNQQTVDTAGDGAINTFTQTQFTRNDTLTLTCTTAQTGGQPGLFSIRSKIEGTLPGIVITADGTTDHPDSFLGKNLGVASLIIDPGSASNEWQESDQIIIITTSDDRSILLVVWRDRYQLLLPNSATPTISNQFVPNVEVFPVSPLDGDEVVLEGLRYFYDGTTGEWVESCL